MDVKDITTVTIGINEYVNLFQWARSAISCKWRGTQEEQGFQNKLFHLQSVLQRLSDSLPEMYDLINRAEWRSHKDGVAELLPKLKDVVYDVEDLLDELRWYNHKVIVEGNASQSSITDFFNSFINVNDIHERLDHISNCLDKKGLGELTPRFDRTVRPETSSFANETKIFGRGMELKQILRVLGVPTHNHSKDKWESHANKSRLPNLPILSIVGIGDVGKTTLAQHICSHPQVKSHYDTVIWICVSDDFDEKRLTKEAIESCPGKEATTNNLNSLQHALSKILENRKFLIVLDDLWDDALKENGLCWKRFCAPLINVLQGSMMLVTTRSPKVADFVSTMEPIILEGLKDDEFWNFFKLCVFGSESSNDFPELELVGRKILPKLKGSPLAARTLGRMLRDDLRTSHWTNILNSELWALDQETTEIVPALRLSYIYLPFHLKRCFSFCAVYPKDKKFEKDSLAEIWAAQGFVKCQGAVPLQDIGRQCFNDLLNSQENEIEVLADLQPPASIKSLVLDNCPAVSSPSWFQPQSLPSLISVSFLRCFSSLTDLIIDGCYRLSSLEQLLHPTYLPAIKKIAIMSCWNLISVGTERFGDFHCLEIFKLVDCGKLNSESLTAPSLMKLVLHGRCENLMNSIQCCSLTNFFLSSCPLTSIQLKMWNLPALQELHISDCRSLASIGQSGHVFTNLIYLTISNCEGLSLTSIGQSEQVFRNLISLTMKNCTELSTIDGMLEKEYLPAIKSITFDCCPKLFIYGKRFGDFSSLKDLKVSRCHGINWGGLVLPSSLQILHLESCGDISSFIPSGLENLQSLVSLNLLWCENIRSIPGHLWSSTLSSLQELQILYCWGLVSIGGADDISEIQNVLIEGCFRLNMKRGSFLISKQKHEQPVKSSNNSAPTPTAIVSTNLED
ncbi:putative disease resistance protein RGA4 [Triticum aestivum]|uniref:putative disease resistance protein RGA4 n=1 Tax=Triticum aestivum TaxID=4565 RepID=UPI001D016A82|nr:putative disease resistance protein RGA4 [Triticum aestivum]